MRENLLKASPTIGNMSEERPHPLYPEQNPKKGIRWISLYEPKECMLCAKLCKDWEWKNITQSDSTFYGAGFSVNIEFMRVCKPCGMNHAGNFIWG